MMTTSVSLLLVTCCTNPCTASVPEHCIGQETVGVMVAGTQIRDGCNTTLALRNNKC